MLRWFARELRECPPLAFMLVCMLAFLVLLFILPVGRVYGHDHSHPELDSWYQSLMQPDAPASSCCGEADAYWCDDYYSRDGKAYCKITDDRPDAPLKRPHVDIGTEIEIPAHKLKHDRGNPTGHAVVFLSRNQYVYCFVQNGGV